MANIKNSEIKFLEELRDKLYRYSEFREECAELDTLLARQKEMTVKRNARAWEHIKKKRETDPTYGRSKQMLKKYKCYQRETNTVVNEMFDTWFGDKG